MIEFGVHWKVGMVGEMLVEVPDVELKEHRNLDLGVRFGRFRCMCIFGRSVSGANLGESAQSPDHGGNSVPAGKVSENLDSNFWTAPRSAYMYSYLAQVSHNGRDFSAGIFRVDRSNNARASVGSAFVLH